MHRMLTAVLVVTTLSSCATAGRETPEVSWDECAKARAVAWLETGIPTGWTRAEALPQGVLVQPVLLGAFPQEAIHDAQYRTLHLVPSENAMYLEQTGGIAGIREFYGPISLVGHCSAATARPNSSSKPTPLRGAA